jgi:hypothetical protein
LNRKQKPQPRAETDEPAASSSVFNDPINTVQCQSRTINIIHHLS